MPCIRSAVNLDTALRLGAFHNDRCPRPTRRRGAVHPCPVWGIAAAPTGTEAWQITLLRSVGLTPCGVTGRAVLTPRPWCLAAVATANVRQHVVFLANNLHGRIVREGRDHNWRLAIRIRNERIWTLDFIADCVHNLAIGGPCTCVTNSAAKLNACQRRVKSVGQAEINLEEMLTRFQPAIVNHPRCVHMPRCIILQNATAPRCCVD